MNEEGHRSAARLDQWLWAVRAYKSRSQAAEAIRLGRVEVNGHAAKPAHHVKAGEAVRIHHWEEERILEVRAVPESRVAAKRVPEFATLTIVKTSRF